MQFEFQEETASIIKVIGIGGGGGNAVNFMFNQGITGVNFIICNTDAQALEKSPVPIKIQLGPSLTEGRGAGAVPEVGREATLESEQDIRDLLAINTKMVFITAGMGGGTGTGGAPVVARIAKELGILTVAIVTVPFDFEGKTKRDKASHGLDELKENVDAIIVISNNKLKEIYGNLSLTNAFSQADNILATAAKGISEIITKPGLVNVDFEDVKTVMKESGVAIMGAGLASGENRALKAIDSALTSPLLSDNDIYGAKGILLYITSGKNEVTMDEVSQITGLVQQAANNDTELIWGICHDETLEDEIGVTLIATGFQTGLSKDKPKGEIVRHTMDEDEKPALLKQEPQNQVIVENIEAEVSPLQEIEEEIIYYNESIESQSFTLEDSPSDENEIEEEEELNIEMEKELARDLEMEREIEIEKIKLQENEIELEVPLSHKTQLPLFGGDDEDFKDEDFQKMHMERMKAIKSLVNISHQKNQENIHELERVPAYERQNINLDNSKMYSTESHFSKYTLDDNLDTESEDRFEFKKNSFLDEKAD